MTDDLKDYEVIVAVCGGIAAYKVCSVVSDLVQRGAGTQVVMTRAATKFVRPLTFRALTGREVFTSMWTGAGYHGHQHIQLTEVSDLMLVAPATANMLGQVAHGMCDDLVSTMILSADCPVVFAPSMNARMWQNPVVQQNVECLKQHGYAFVDPAEGWLSCRTVGVGRLAEAETIVEAVVRKLKPRASKSAEC